MRQYRSYVLVLEHLAHQALTEGLSVADRTRHLAAVNGEASAMLSQLVPLDDRKAAGAFFTGTALGIRALRPAQAAGTLRTSDVSDEGATARAVQTLQVLDPSCGAGDLLLSWATRLPVARDLPATLALWGRVLHGRDIEPLFVRAARARLTIAAALRAPTGAGAERRPPLHENAAAHSPTSAAEVLETAFPGIRVGDGLDREPMLGWRGRVVLNPPFLKVQAPDDCSWGSGTVSSAAVFVDHCLRHAAAGTRVTAILPDVLRTGERYTAWRREVERRAEVERIEVHGIFDPAVDVDVFFLDLVVRAGAPVDPRDPTTVLSRTGRVEADTAAGERSGVWWNAPVLTGERLEHYFALSVGAVVPHRHAEEGPEVAYLHATDAPAWGVVRRISTRRQFSGRLETPPFVVVRRTSGPHDAQRAIATIVLGKRPVAVENHLIVLRPLDGTEATCHAALPILRSNETKAWLNERIRCRHLTVAALREVPWRAPDA
jgi:hypothetical protein